MIASRLSASHRLVEAEEAAAMGLKAAPRHVRLIFEHAFALVRQGRVEAGVEELAKAIKQHQTDANLRMLLAFSLNYDARATPDEVAAAHLQYGIALRRVAGPAMKASELVAARQERFPRAAHPRLRVGLVSADLYRHSVAYFLEPLLANLPTDRIEIVVLSSASKSDDVTARLRACAGEWIDAAGMDHDAFTKVARSAALDVAIDLSGLTSGHRQMAFARRIAPVQASYLGYPHASGVDTFDARIADAITDPPSARNLMGENVLRLPGCFVCYGPANDTPPIRERAASGLGESAGGRGQARVRFGCFGNLAKINRATLGAWSRVLAGVPDSALVLKNHAFADRFVRGGARAGAMTILDRLREADIDPTRIDIREPGKDEVSHLDAYNDIDIALDTFPYHGTTTTCEAIAMGVPVVTCAGDRHASRVGRSLLTAANCAQWCGENEGEFIEKAIELGREGPRDAVARQALRERVLASALCDARAHASSFVGVVESLAASLRR